MCRGRWRGGVVFFFQATTARLNIILMKLQLAGVNGESEMLKCGKEWVK